MTAQYLDIIAKVRAGTHRIRSYKGARGRTRFDFEYLSQRRNEWMPATAEHKALLRASKELPYRYDMTLGVVYEVAA
jgi:hypothetical protein